MNDWWNRPANPIIDLKVPRDQVVAFGLYTVANGILKLSAQLYPLYPSETREVRLEVEREGRWVELARRSVNDLGWSTAFRIEKWDHSRDQKYRLRHGERAFFEGLIRKSPGSKDEIKLAAFSCNSNRDRGLRPEYTRNLNHQDPDLVFFAGDQSYDHKEHTAAWLKFGLAFKEIVRSRPCVSIPDDHDIGQGNLWGENGKIATSPAGDSGGYFFHHDYIKMVERQQCANLPDPFDPAPVDQGIGVYYTSLNVGGVDFAILEDRKFKTGPLGRHPMKGPRPDHILDPNYDPAIIDTPASNCSANASSSSSPIGVLVARVCRCAPCFRKRVFPGAPTSTALRRIASTPISTPTAGRNPAALPLSNSSARPTPSISRAISTSPRSSSTASTDTAMARGPSSFPPLITVTTAAGGGPKTRKPGAIASPIHRSRGRATTSTASTIRSQCTPTRIPMRPTSRAKRAARPISANPAGLTAGV